MGATKGPTDLTVQHMLPERVLLVFSMMLSADNTRIVAIRREQVACHVVQPHMEVTTTTIDDGPSVVHRRAMQGALLTSEHSLLNSSVQREASNRGVEQRTYYVMRLLGQHTSLAR